MAVVVSTNDTYLSVCLNLLKGKYDQTLRWPFIGSVDVTILNQISDSDHFEGNIEVLQEDRIQAGDYMEDVEPFILLTKLPLHLKGSKLVEYVGDDDCMYLKVAVTVPTYRPWLDCGQ